MAMNSQQVRGSVRAPRVHIKYEVETEGAIEIISLPFVLGMMADLSGHTKKKPLAQREFTDISTANFSGTMREIAPSLKIQVDNRLQPAQAGGETSTLSADLKFGSIEDFEPEQVAKNFKPTQELVELRKKLQNLLSRLEGQSEADELLQQVIKLSVGDSKGSGAEGSNG